MTTTVLLRSLAMLGVAAALAAPRGVSAQDLADYDYENLGFQGVAATWGWMVPSRVEPTYSVGLQADLGYLGPALSITPTLEWWSSRLKASEVKTFEDRLSALIARETPGPPPAVDLGTIDWSDVSMGLDAQVVWAVRQGFLTSAGLGTSVHFLNGSGDAIQGTFIEDLLDSVTAGFNVHGGIEVPVARRFRLFGQARYELLEDLRWFEVRFGGQIMTSLATGEGGAR